MVSEHFSSDDHLKEVLRRHIAFWKREEVQRPIVGRSRFSYFPRDDFDIGIKDGPLHPEMLKLDHLVPQYERIFQNGGLFMGDLLWAANPLWGIPWLEAILGCQVELSKEDPSFWSVVAYEEINDVPEIALDPNNLWFKKLMEFVNDLARHARGRYPLATPLMRGPVDMMAALIGTEKLAYAAYDYPQKAETLAIQCAEVFIEVAKAQLKLMPSFHEGFSQQQHIWAPGYTVMTQQDAALFFTPQKYRDLILPADKMIAESFDYVIMHFHSGSLHTLEDFLGMGELECIQIVVDSMGPSLDDLVRIFKKVQEIKPLVIFADLNDEEIGFLLNQLSAAGLCIYVKNYS